MAGEFVKKLEINSLFFVVLSGEALSKCFILFYFFCRLLRVVALNIDKLVDILSNS